MTNSLPSVSTRADAVKNKVGALAGKGASEGGPCTGSPPYSSKDCLELVSRVESKKHRKAKLYEHKNFRESWPLSKDEKTTDEELKTKYPSLDTDQRHNLIRGYANFSVKEMWEAAKDCDSWNSQFGNDLLFEPVDDKDLNFHSAFVELFHGTDKYGHPVSSLDFSQINSKKLASVLDEPDILVRVQSRKLLASAYLKQRLSKCVNFRIRKNIFIMNLDGLSIFSFLRYQSIVKGVMDVGLKYFPETLLKVYLVNPSRVFYTIWNIAKYWLDPVTLGNIHVIKDVKDAIPLWKADGIDITALPQKLGGEGKVSMNISKVISKIIETAAEDARIKSRDSANSIIPVSLPKPKSEHTPTFPQNRGNEREQAYATKAVPKSLTIQKKPKDSKDQTLVVIPAKPIVSIPGPKPQTKPPHGTPASPQNRETEREQTHATTTTKAVPKPLTIQEKPIDSKRQAPIVIPTKRIVTMEGLIPGPKPHAKPPHEIKRSAEPEADPPNDSPTTEQTASLLPESPPVVTRRRESENTGKSLDVSPGPADLNSPSSISYSSTHKTTIQFHESTEEVVSEGLRSHSDNEDTCQLLAAPPSPRSSRFIRSSRLLLFSRNLRVVCRPRREKGGLGQVLFRTANRRIAQEDSI